MAQDPGTHAQLHSNAPGSPIKLGIKRALIIIIYSQQLVYDSKQTAL